MHHPTSSPVVSRCLCGAPNCRGTMDPQPERKRDFGRRVEVYWPDDVCYYRATVVNYSIVSGKHHLHYDDGYVERIVLKVLPHPPPPPTPLICMARCQPQARHINICSELDALAPATHSDHFCSTLSTSNGYRSKAAETHRLLLLLLCHCRPTSSFMSPVSKCCRKASTDGLRTAHPPSPSPSGRAPRRTHSSCRTSIRQPAQVQKAAPLQPQRDGPARTIHWRLVHILQEVQYQAPHATPTSLQMLRRLAPCLFRTLRTPTPLSTQPGTGRCRVGRCQAACRRRMGCACEP